MLNQWISLFDHVIVAYTVLDVLCLQAYQPSQQESSIHCVTQLSNIVMDT